MNSVKEKKKAKVRSSDRFLATLSAFGRDGLEISFVEQFKIRKQRGIEYGERMMHLSRWMFASKLRRHQGRMHEEAMDMRL